MIDIEKYPLEKLSDVSTILSSSGFQRMFRNDAGNSNKTLFIYAPETYNPENMEFVMGKARDFEKGYAILADTQIVNSDYLTSILNTFVSWAYITKGRVEEKTSITMKKLSNISVRVLPSDLQIAVLYLHHLILDIRNQKKDNNDPYLDYWISVYKEVLNSIALELVAPRMFKKYEIDMLGSWYSLIERCSKENLDVELEQLKEELEKELLVPQNAVVGNMKKLRVVMRRITEQVPDKV